MTRRPWYKRDGAAFIAGTIGLTLEEKGAYSLCLDLIYSQGGPIPDDARWLSGVCGVSLRKWAALRDRLITLDKLTTEGGFLMNPRAVREIEALETDHQAAVENGSRGGQKRVEKSSKPERKVAETSAKSPRNITENGRANNENSGLGQATLNQERIEGDIEGEEERDLSAGADRDAAAPSPSKPAPLELPLFLDRRRQQPSETVEEIDTTPAPSAEVVTLVPAPEREIDAAVEVYNLSAEYAGKVGRAWTRCQHLNDARRRQLKARLAECGGLDGWKLAMSKAVQSSFLLGKTGRSGEHANWKPGLDFFLQPKSFTKLMEGGFDDATSNAGGGGNGGGGAGGILDRAAQAAAVANSLRN